MTDFNDSICLTDPILEGIDLYPTSPASEDIFTPKECLISEVSQKVKISDLTPDKSLQAILMAAFDGNDDGYMTAGEAFINNKTVCNDSLAPYGAKIYGYI